MRLAYPIILAIVVLDAVGIGLTLPILPRLLQEVGHLQDLGWRFGAFLSLYALMQMLFSPVLGSLSDRFGRRPVLVLSLAGASVDYMMMALTPSLGLLVLGRAISGITGATGAVAGAFISDITPEADRTRRFGHLSACFGVGFIIGPALGGWLGSSWVRAPFLAAALLNGLTMVLAWLVLPESRREATTPAPVSFNPLAPLRDLLKFPGLGALVFVYGLFALVGEIGGTIWVLYGQDKFHWNTLTVGFSLTGFGLFHALVQAFAAGPLAARLGERRTLFFGMAADMLAYVGIALATQGWVAFALLPLFCLGSVGPPVLQTLLAAKVGEDAQGRLQGVLASAASVATVIGPAIISEVYFRTRGVFPGFVWLAGCAIYLLAVPALRTVGRPVGLAEVPESLDPAM